MDDEPDIRQPHIHNTAEDFPDKKLTTLDTKVWVENHTIQYAFNEKKVPSKTTIKREVHCQIPLKISSLTQDIISIPDWSYQTHSW